MPLRRAAKEKIAAARDKALREIGPRVGGDGSNRAGWLIATLFMAFLGIGLVGASRRASPVARPARDNVAWTTNVLAVAAMALEHYKVDTGHYPSLREGGLAALTANPGAPGWNGPYLSGLGNDGWNRPFAYIPAESAGERPPDLRSAGLDRMFETDDDLVAAPGLFRVHPDFVPSRPGETSSPAPVSVVIDKNWL
jgi:general secretion pathway protein G